MADSVGKLGKWRKQIFKENFKSDPEYDESEMLQLIAQKETEEEAESDIEELIKERDNLQAYMDEKERAEEERLAKIEADAEAAAEKAQKEADRQAEIEARGDDPLSNDAMLEIINANEAAGKEAFTIIVDNLIDELWELAIPTIVKEMAEEQAANELAEAEKAKEIEDKANPADRINDAYGHINRLAKYRMVLRQRFGSSFTYFQPI